MARKALRRVPSRLRQARVFGAIRHRRLAHRSCALLKRRKVVSKGRHWKLTMTVNGIEYHLVTHSTIAWCIRRSHRISDRRERPRSVVAQAHAAVRCVATRGCWCYTDAAVKHRPPERHLFAGAIELSDDVYQDSTMWVPSAVTHAVGDLPA